jgi:tetratricopeptide (TPR) repeat protein
MADQHGVLVLLCLPIGALIIILIPPAISQHYYTEGNLAATRGHNQEAINNFRKAMRWDSWHAYDVDLYATIGQLQKQTGISSNSPERHIRRAVDLRDANEYEASIFEFSRAVEAGGALAETAQREAAATRMAFGLALYRANGIGSAVTNWEATLAEDPSLIYVLPYLARGYYPTRALPGWHRHAQRLVKLIKDHDLYSPTLTRWQLIVTPN